MTTASHFKLSDFSHGSLAAKLELVQILSCQAGCDSSDAMPCEKVLETTCNMVNRTIFASYAVDAAYNDRENLEMQFALFGCSSLLWRTLVALSPCNLRRWV